jgi:hypothetical protein
MDASDLIKTLHNPLAGGGPSTYGGQGSESIHNQGDNGKSIDVQEPISDG